MKRIASVLTGLALTSFAFGAAAFEFRNRVDISTQGKYRYIKSNGIPDHTPGQFPTRGNPNRISEQKYVYRVPLNPKANSRSAPSQRTVFGVALNGVPYDPGTAEFWAPNASRPTRDRSSGWNYDALSGKINLGLDKHNAHVQPTGAYHYHGLPTGHIRLQSEGKAKQMTLVGYAADGFPIYAVYGHADAGDPNSKLVALKPSYALKKGTRPSGTQGPGGRYDGTFVQDWEYVAGSGDLDECNGRTGVTPEYPNGTYYYVLSDSYPFIPRRFMGTPDASFKHRAGGQQQGGERRRGGERGHHPPPHHHHPHPHPGGR